MYLINSMVTQLIRAVKCFKGKFKQPIKLEILATGAAILTLAAIGFMANFAIYSP